MASEFAKELGKSALAIVVLGTVIYGTITALELIDRKWVKPGLKKIVDKAEAKAEAKVAGDVKATADEVVTAVSDVVNPDVSGAAANG
jgi:hypothetical protein